MNSTTSFKPADDAADTRVNQPAYSPYFSLVYSFESMTTVHVKKSAPKSAGQILEEKSDGTT